MTWGTGKWGETSPWGTGVALPPPVLAAASPTIVERRGGTVIKLLGENFFDPMTVDILQSSVVVANGYIFDPEFDLERNRAFVAMPALPDGFYDIQVTTDGGTSGVLVNAVEYRLHSEEVKVQRVRIGFAQPWVTGPRLLTNPTTDLEL
jgi:hypothetical protein